MGGYKIKIKDMPPGERPRERLINQGSEALSNAELLAILLRTGTKDESVLNLASRILSEYSLKDLARASVGELKKIHGISDAKACQIAACFELARRVAVSSADERPVIKSSAEAFRVLQQRLSQRKVEAFAGLYMNSKNRVLRFAYISQGGMEASVVQPREVFRIALEEAATRVIVAHNHPSGDPEPSEEDIRITRVLKNAGELIGIELLDHLVIGDGRYVSLRDRGYM